MAIMVELQRRAAMTKLYDLKLWIPSHALRTREDWTGPIREAMLTVSDLDAVKARARFLQILQKKDSFGGTFFRVEQMYDNV